MVIPYRKWHAHGRASRLRTRVPERTRESHSAVVFEIASGELRPGRLMPGTAESGQRIGERHRLQSVTGTKQSQAVRAAQLEYEMECRGRNHRSRALRNRARALRESVLGAGTHAVAMHPHGAHSHRTAAIRAAAGTRASQRRRNPGGHNCREESEQRQTGDELSHYLALVAQSVRARQVRVCPVTPNGTHLQTLLNTPPAELRRRLYQKPTPAPLAP